MKLATILALALASSAFATDEATHQRLVKERIEKLEKKLVSLDKQKAKAMDELKTLKTQ